MTEPTNVQRVLQDEIAQSGERIARDVSRLASLPADAAQAASRDAISKTLAAERERKLDLDRRLAQHLGVGPRRRRRWHGIGATRWLRMALGLAGLIAALVLQHQAGH